MNENSQLGKNYKDKRFKARVPTFFLSSFAVWASVRDTNGNQVKLSFKYRNVLTFSLKNRNIYKYSVIISCF